MQGTVSGLWKIMGISAGDMSSQNVTAYPECIGPVGIPHDYSG